MHTPVHMHFRTSMHPVHAHEGQRRMPHPSITLHLFLSGRVSPWTWAFFFLFSFPLWLDWKPENPSYLPVSVLLRAGFQAWMGCLTWNMNADQNSCLHDYRVSALSYWAIPSLSFRFLCDSKIRISSLNTVWFWIFSFQLFAFFMPICQCRF